MMDEASGLARTLILTLLLIGDILRTSESFPQRGSHRRTLRLCSKGLSDALFLVCKDRGYNELFSYSGEWEQKAPVGPGLVEECCYRSCSYDLLEQYCKPLPDEKQMNSYDTAEEMSFRVVNLPYSSVRELEAENESRSREGNVGNERTRKRKNPKGKSEGMGKHDLGNARGWLTEDIATTKKKKMGHEKCRCRCRRRRRKRRRRGKTSPALAIPSVPAFQVGTTSPEPIDSIHLFPSKSFVRIE